MTQHDIADLETALGYRFRDPALLVQALTHSSQAREAESQTAGDAKYQVQDNEQLEFLGDAILSLVTSEDLYRRFPDFREGELSKLRAHVVSERHLLQVARQLQLGDHLRLGRGEEKSGGRAKTTLLADAVEAVLAAIYLDGGFDEAREFVRRAVLGPELDNVERQGGSLPVLDFKSALQERTQSLGLPQPSYALVKETGPEHRKTFTVEARVAQKDAQTALASQADGATKKAAEQEAAQHLLEQLGLPVGNGATRDGNQ
jgi:ribonuclease III